MDSVEDRKKRCQLAQLRNAIINFSNSRITKKILATGVDVNHKFLINSSDESCRSGSSTALHLAATRSFNNCQVLLDHGADVTIKDSEGLTALHRVLRDCLSKDGDESPSSPFISSVLLAHVKSGNFVNPSDNQGFTHFHAACVMDNVEAVKFFLNNGVAVNHAVHRDASLFAGFTPLHFTARFASLQSAEVLIERGANATLKDARGMTPMYVLVERKIAMLELIDAKEKLDGRQSVRAMLEQIHDNEDILRLLLDSDIADDNCTDEIGMSKYHALCTLQNSAVAAGLLERIADVDAHINLDSRLWPGYTMLHFAAHCNVHTMRLLLENGANIQAKDANGVTPFDICIKWCKLEDLHSIMNMIRSWQDISFSDGRTKLLDCIAALRRLDLLQIFLRDSVGDANIFLPSDSPLWTGCTLLHLSVIFAERFTVKDNSAKQAKAFQSLTPAEINSNIVKACLDFGTAINCRDVRGRTALHLAFRSNKSRVVEMLLPFHHENLNVVDDENLSHLHIACAMRNKCVIEKWLGSNVQVDVNIAYKGSGRCLPTVKPGWTPLHVAVFCNADSSLVKMLLDAGADPYQVGDEAFTAIHLLLVSPQIDPSLSKLLLSLTDLRESVAGDTVFSHLHVASYFNNVEAVEKLLDFGAKIDALSSLPRFENCTPLQLATMNTCMAVVDVLVRRGADVLARRPDGSTPLSKALTSNTHHRSLKSFVAVLRSNDRLRRCLETDLGLTILHVVCRAGHVDAVKDLLNKGADVNAKLHNDSPFWPGWTPLHVLVAMGIEVVHQKKQQNDFKAMLEMLLQHGSQVTAVDANGDTPLHLMLKTLPCNTGYFIMTLLLSHQEDFSANPVNKNGLTHFHIACLANNLEAAQKFLAHDGMDVNQPIDYFAEQCAGSTPLHLALHSNSKRYFGLENQLRMVDLLLKHKPDIRAEDDHAYTPLHVAADCDPTCLGLLQKLVDNGADINAQTIDGRTAFEMILLSKEISVEEIKFFVKQDYHINGCNPMSDRGYLSLILNEKNVKLRSEILKELMSTASIVITDEMGRTAIHNVVSTDDLVILEHQYVDMIDKLAKLGCDVNEQDQSGMTALHLAIVFRNREAIRALLICGVDINIVDSCGKTAFSYALDPCTRCLARCNTVHDDLLKLLVEHVHTMRLLGLYVSEQNEKMKSLALENRWIKTLPAKLVLVDESNKHIKSIVIGPRGWTLHDFLKEHGPVDEYHSLTQTDRLVIDQFFQNIDYHSFRDLRYLLKVQYREAVAKGPLIKPAIASVQILSGLPDLCADAIVYYLRNSDLKNLTTAANTHE